MEDFLIQYQDVVLLTCLIAVPLVILMLFIILGRKNHDLAGRFVMAVSVIYMYDTFILGISLLHLLFGTGSEYYIFAAVGILPSVIGVAVILIYQGKLAWSGIGARIIAANVVYFLSVFYVLAIILGIGQGLGFVLLVGTVPIVFGVLVFFLLRRSYVVITTNEDEIVFLKEDYDEKEVYDYINHLQ